MSQTALILNKHKIKKRDYLTTYLINSYLWVVRFFLYIILNAWAWGWFSHFHNKITIMSYLSVFFNTFTSISAIFFIYRIKNYFPIYILWLFAPINHPITYDSSKTTDNIVLCNLLLWFFEIHLIFHHYLCQNQWIKLHKFYIYYASV